LFSLSVSASTLPSLIERDQQGGVEQARAIAGLAEHTLLDLRSLLLELRPSSLLQQGLSEALRSLCTESGVEAECSLILTGHYVPAPIEDIVYRIAQEAISNVNKHAEASSVTISLVEGKRKLTMSVSDDGSGFDPEHVKGSGKFGLMSMRERANSVGGELTIESDPTRGTTIQVILPLERDMQA
jgi:signal transduction histidine kinase